jgi:hypothetical protein
MLSGLQILVANQFYTQFFNTFSHARTNEGIQFVFEFVERRMGIKLGITRGQDSEQLQQVGLTDPRVLQETKYPLRMVNFRAVQR